MSESDTMLGERTRTYEWLWSATPIERRPSHGRGIFLVPVSQQETTAMVRQLANAAPVLSVVPTRIGDELGKQLGAGQRRFTFVTRTRWRDGVDEDALAAFLQILQACGGTDDVELDVITVRAIDCPAYDGVVHALDASFLGLALTAAREFPRARIRCFSLAALDEEHLRDALEADVSNPSQALIGIGNGQYWLPRLCEPPVATLGETVLRERGTYVIFGAGGGLGGLLAKHLAKNYRARLVLIGRRASDEKLVRELIDLGADAIYEQVDISDLHALRHILAKYPDINGVVHSALVLQDASLLTMTRESLLQVLRPKLHGTYNLIEALRYRRLDFVLFFSSIQSYIANAGQGNYTAACLAKDALAGLLGNARQLNVKVINWGYWGSVGIVAADFYRERMRRLGIGSIEPSEGIAIIESLLRSSSSRIAAIKASPTALAKLHIGREDLETPRSGTAASSSKPSAGQESVPAQLLASIVPAYDSGSAETQRNLAASAALEQYARHRIKAISLPQRSLPRFARLCEALSHIEPTGAIERTTLLSRHPELAGHVELLETCLAEYPRILSGQTDPLGVLFPNGSFHLVEKVYRDNPISNHFNAKVAEVIAAFAAKSPAARKLRILEVGAGTGSTTEFVVPLLRNLDVEYTFTDLSHAFLNKARAKFRDYAFMKYEILNIEDAGARAAQWDVLIATNVIHATRDIGTTVRNCRNLLRPGGLFVLNEVTSRTDFATITFGLTDGWWLSADPHRIPQSPLLSGATWRAILLESGFDAVREYGNADQQVIAAAIEVTRNVTPNSAPTLDVAARAMSPKQHAFVDPRPMSRGGDREGDSAIAAFVKQTIATIMQMDVDEIADDTPFHDYGIDSLIALELVKPLQERFGYLPATILFEHPTLAKLTTHLRERSVPQVAQPARAKISTALAPAGTQDPVAGIRTFIRQTIADVMHLHTDELADDTPFKDFGIDSIISLELLAPLSVRFGYVPATLLFEFPTIGSLASYFSKTMEASSVSDRSAPAVSPAASERAASAHETVPGDAIAIIGMAGRFPNADDCEQLWKRLRAGANCTSAVPADRWQIAGPQASAQGSPGYTNVGAFVADVDAFDHRFFGLTPADAQRMDPQERLFLETSYLAVLDSGYSSAALKGKAVGVFVGVMNAAYAWLTPTQPDASRPSSHFWSIANRVSYTFDLRGPSMAVDTACSSSLTALHVAAQALRAGDCDCALVGGVNLIVHPRQYDNLCSLHMLSPSGVCKPFGANADGFVDGEGVCALVVKKYADAVRDGDRIYAVMLGSAVNSGGRANGYSAPNPEAQTALINRALQRAAVPAESISYVEAHGTGTELGDPIEIKGLAGAFAGCAPQTIAIGSIKGNIGHLESAAGLASVIKVVLQMQAGELAPSLNAARENPHLELERSPFKLNNVATAWLDTDRPRRACVSSFGAGGANAHAVLQSQVARPHDAANRRGRYFIPLSAKTTTALQLQVDALRAWLSDRHVDMAALSYTLCCARDHFKHRLLLIVRDQAELSNRLSSDIQDLTAPTRETQNDGGPDELLRALEIPVDPTTVDSAKLAIAYLGGRDIPWHQLFENRVVISTHGYAFEKSRHWVRAKESSFRTRETDLADHSIAGQQIAPAAYSIAAIVEELKCSGLRDVTWGSAVRAVDGIRVERFNDLARLVHPGNGEVYCEARIASTRAATQERTSFELSRTDHVFTHEAIYRRFAAAGYDYGPAYRTLRWARSHGQWMKSFIADEYGSRFRLSPALLDAGLQTAALFPDLEEWLGADRICVPVALDELIVHRLPTEGSAFCFARLLAPPRAGRALEYDIFFTDARRKPLVELRGLSSMIVDKAQLMARAKIRSSQTPRSPIRVEERVLELADVE